MKPTVNRQQYGMFLANACRGVPAEFLLQKSKRIDLAHAMGETPEMLAREMEMIYSLRRPAATKSPRQLAKSVMRIHDTTIRALRNA
jgi:hypothetical protein